MDRVNIKVGLMNLIEAKWKPSNTILDDIPHIHTGWFDRANKKPQVTITTEQYESDLYSGISQNGIVKDYDGSVQVNTWIEENLNKGYRKQLSDEMAQEIKRIIHENYDELDGYWYISVISADEKNDIERNPTLYRYNFMVAYKYRDIL